MSMKSNSELIFQRAKKVILEESMAMLLLRQDCLTVSLIIVKKRVDINSKMWMERSGLISCVVLVLSYMDIPM